MLGIIIFLIFPIVVIILFIGLAVSGESARQEMLIRGFCNDLQFYNFQQKWKEVARDVYNSLSIGMTFDEAKVLFEASKEKIKPIEEIESFNGIPIFMMHKYAITKGREYIQAHKKQFDCYFTESSNYLRNTMKDIKPVLMSEEKLSSGLIRTVYKWDLAFSYVTSQYDGKNIGNSVGGAVTFGAQNGNSIAGAYTAINTTTTSDIHSATTEKAYIELTFEDGKMVSRTQKGLFEI